MYYNDNKQIKIVFSSKMLPLCNDLIERLASQGIKSSLSDIVNLLINEGYFRIETETLDISQLYARYKNNNNL
jgi:hypothetical protein